VSQLIIPAELGSKLLWEISWFQTSWGEPSCTKFVGVGTGAGAGVLPAPGPVLVVPLLWELELNIPFNLEELHEAKSNIKRIRSLIFTIVLPLKFKPIQGVIGTLEQDFSPKTHFVSKNKQLHQLPPHSLWRNLRSKGDIAFQGLTVTFVSPSSGNYLLSTSDTSAKGAATDLSADAIFPFDVDILGIIRTDPWDIGASTPQ
jgi:hypothetical protein